jgi:hypothetical protein
MHVDDRTGAAASKIGVRWRAVVLAAAIVIAVLTLLAPAALAASTYVGGPRAGDFPLYVANDHSVYTLRFEVPAVAEGEVPWLLPETEYYVKIRLSPSTGPSGSANRGFTWNPTTQMWAQERADWTEFPTITSDEDGAYVPGNEWFAFKFADVTKSGTYYILVSLQPVDAGAGTTMNNLAPPAVTVTDPAGVIVGATPAYWVHNGVATGASSAKRVDAVPSGGTDIWSLSRTEANLVDDDGNGVVDDEDYGPAGATGDFSLAVPAGMAFDVRLQSVIWPTVLPLAALQNGYLADVDIAYGNADQTPPSAITGLTATAGDATVSLTWDAAPDEDGIDQYRVYRWTDPTPIGDAIQYTSQPDLVATTTDTAYEDATVVNGEDYYYLVRAADAATNVGPRSNEATAAPRIATALTIDAAEAIVAYKGSTTLTVHLTDSLAAPLAGYLVDVQSSLDGITWTTFAYVESDGGTVATPALTRATKFRATWAGAGEYSGSTSGYVLVKPKVYLGAPRVPDYIREDVGFLVYGTLKPRHMVGWNKAVKLYCWRKNKLTDQWVLKKTAWCKTVTYLTYSRYRRTIALPSTGVWKIRAFAPEDLKHAATWSASTYLRVR